MSAGFRYNINPEAETEERYDVQTGVRRRGSYILDTANIPEGSTLPSFAPVAADLKKGKCSLVRNFTVAEKYVNASSPNAIKVKKGSFPYAGMHLGNGSKGATVESVDTSDSKYDKLNLSAAFGEDLESGAVIFEATAVGGKKQKNVANSALYGNFKVMAGVNNVSLLRTAAEIEPDKLAIPFSDNDKDALKGWFQFND